MSHFITAPGFFSNTETHLEILEIGLDIYY